MAQACNSRQQLPQPRSLLPHYTIPTANSSRRRALKSTSTSDSSGSSGSSGSTSSSSKPRTHPPKITPRYYPYVADTKPERTARLWQAVMTHLGDKQKPSYLKETRSSASRNNGVAKSMRSETRSTTTTKTSPTSFTTAESRAPKPGKAKVTDGDFRTAVLGQFGVTIDESGSARDPIKHFGLTGMPADPKRRLKIYMTKFPGLEVWKNPKIGDVVGAYTFMKFQGCNEAMFSTFALRHIFRDQIVRQQAASTKCLLPYQAVEYVLKKDTLSLNLECPPPVRIDPHPRKYEWDIRPDCLYFVSTEAFRPEFRGLVSLYTYVIHQRAICPYLTIEFKKDGEKYEVAQCQVATAAALALYNRYLLKRNMLEAIHGDKWSNAWTDENKRHIKHYGITFTGPDLTLWYVEPKSFPNWTGCTMRLITRDSCTTAEGVGFLLGFLNDVHYWGLGEHAESCRMDIYCRHLFGEGADRSRASTNGVASYLRAASLLGAGNLEEEAARLEEEAARLEEEAARLEEEAASLEEDSLEETTSPEEAASLEETTSPEEAASLEEDSLEETTSPEEAASLEDSVKA